MLIEANAGLWNRILQLLYTHWQCPPPTIFTECLSHVLQIAPSNFLPLDGMQFFFCRCVEKGNATEHTNIVQDTGFLYVLLFFFVNMNFPQHQSENNENTRNNYSLKFSKKSTHAADPSDISHLAKNNIEKEANKTC